MTLADLVQSCSRILAFTGAGISTESGIADFRGPGGLWETYTPVYFDEFLSDAARRRDHWDYKKATWDSFKGAKPNAGHMALVKMHEQGKLLGIITQNIDGLHEASGIPAGKLTELHGSNLHVECVGKAGEGCGFRAPSRAYMDALPKEGDWPPCEKCGGWIKPATVSFGQAMPDGPMRQAFTWCAQADLFLVLGSSLTVSPANQFPMHAKDAGAKLVIINQQPTPMDGVADLVLNQGIGQALAFLA